MGQSKFTKFITSLAILGVLGATSYIILGPEWRQIYDKYFPCQRVITYSLGTFDVRFGISKTKFLQAVKDAEAIWEGPTHKNFFDYEAAGKLKVNLVYDYRQEATAKIGAVGASRASLQSEYDSLKAKYDNLHEKYLRDKEAYENKVENFDHSQKELNQIRAMEADLNQEVKELNAMVAEVNDLARSLNSNAVVLNNIGQSRGEEFTEGEYLADRNGEKIDVYEFSTEEKLTRLLAHELGHALGLDHVDDPKAIMYRLNQSTNNEPTAADLAALNAHCRIK